MVRHITGARYLYPNDATHLNEDGLNNLRNLFEEKILYKNYEKELIKRGNDEFFECEVSASVHAMTGECLHHNLCMIEISTFAFT